MFHVDKYIRLTKLAGFFVNILSKCGLYGSPIKTIAIYPKDLNIMVRFEESIKSNYYDRSIKDCFDFIVDRLTNYEMCLITTNPRIGDIKIIGKSVDYYLIEDKIGCGMSLVGIKDVGRVSITIIDDDSISITVDEKLMERIYCNEM